MRHLLLFLSVILLAGGCNPFSPPKYNVEYEVRGTASSVLITYYENARDSTSRQESSGPLPWSYSFTARQGAWVYVSAENGGETGTVTVAIIYKGNLILETSACDSAYCVVTASRIL